jgi:hypothetical protein
MKPDNATPRSNYGRLFATVTEDLPALITDWNESSAISKKELSELRGLSLSGLRCDDMSKKA